MRAVYWKELADYCGSWRFFGLIIVICAISLFATYIASQTIIDDVETHPTGTVFLRMFTTSGGSLPSFLWFISFFGPLVGIVFGFDAINSERSRGTLSRVLSQPLYRDAVINGKFLAGLTVIAILMGGIILMVSGLGLIELGVTPGSAEITRVLCFWAVSVIYLGFWLGLGLVFSVLFRQPVVSALIPIAIWIFLAFFIVMIAGVIADLQHPVNSYSEATEWVKHDDVQQKVERGSPVWLYSEASSFVLDPSRITLRNGAIMAEISESPGAYGVFGEMTVSLKQSLKLVWPHIMVLIGLTGICFAASYIKFVREEIRAT